MSRNGRTAGQISHYAAASGLTADEWLARRDAGLRRCYLCGVWKDRGDAFGANPEQCLECRRALAREQRRKAPASERTRTSARDGTRRREREAEQRREAARAAASERLTDALAGLRVDDDPPVAVREVLAAARDLGASFDAAWPVALARIADDDDHGGGEGWRNALKCTSAAWRTAYAREADPHLARLGALDSPAFDDAERRAREPAVPP